MPSNLFLTTSNDKHRHFALVVDLQDGWTSIEKGHKHAVEIQQKPALTPDGQQVVDPATQQPVENLEVTALPLKDGGHSHTVTNVFVYQKKDRKEDTETDYLNLAKEHFAEACTWDDDFTKKGLLCEKFRVLDQWDQDILDAMDKDQAALVVPLINAVLSVLYGYQKQNASEPKVLPVEGGDVITAEVIDQLVKHVLEANDYRHLCSETFEDAGDIGRGGLIGSIDRSHDHRGKFVIEKCEWDTFHLGPHNKKDGSDAEHAQCVKRIPIKRLQEMYPEKKDALSMDSGGIRYEAIASEPSNNDLNASTGTPVGLYGKDYEKNKARVIYDQYYEYRRIPIVFSNELGLYQELPDINKKDLDKILTIDGVEKTLVVVKDRRDITYCGSVLLDNEISDINEISIIPFYAKKYKDKVISKIFEAMDMQKEINYSFSYVVNALRTTLQNTSYYDDETFAGEEEVQEFLDGGGKPNAALKVNSVDNVPHREKGSDYPAGHAQTEDQAFGRMKDVTNINSSMLGDSSPHESNVAMQNKQRHALMGNEYLFENTAVSTKHLVKIIIKSIPKIMSNPDRVYRILDNRYKQNKFLRLGKEEFSSVTKEKIEEILKNLNVLEYDVLVSESQYSPTKRQYAFAQWLEVFKQGGAKIPGFFQFLIDLNPDLPSDEKQKFKDLLAQFSQANEGKETEKIKTQTAGNIALEQVKQQNKGAASV